MDERRQRLIQMWQILQAVVQQAKKINKAAYVFSVDSENGKVIHVNFVPESIRTKGLTGPAWAAVVSEVVGGKVIILFIDFLH